MKSPAKQHFERVTAALAAASAEPGRSLVGASNYDLMLAKLAADKRRLKAIQSVERKVEVKRDLLPEYATYVAGVLEGGRGAQDDVLMTIMVWRIDAGDFAGALDIAQYALRHSLTLPDQYERSTAAALAEEFAEAALKAVKNGESFDTDRLISVAALTENSDMHDQIRAKLHKAVGLTCIPDSPDRTATEFALQNLRRALQLDARIGVKQSITRLEAALSDSAGSDGHRL